MVTEKASFFVCLFVCFLAVHLVVDAWSNALISSPILIMYLIRSSAPLRQAHWKQEKNCILPVTNHTFIHLVHVIKNKVYIWWLIPLITVAVCQWRIRNLEKYIIMIVIVIGGSSGLDYLWNRYRFKITLYQVKVKPFVVLSNRASCFVAVLWTSYQKVCETWWRNFLIDIKLLSV